MERPRTACVSVLVLAACLTLPVRGWTQSSPPAPSRQEQEAAALLGASDWAGAVTAYRALLQSEASNARAAFGLGVALQQSGQYGDARDAFLQAQKLGYQPVNQIRYRLARAYAKLGDPTNALAMLDALVAAGFANATAMQSPDFASLPAERFAAIVKSVNAAAHPCEGDPNYHAFDFWIGVWDVQPTGAPRAPAGATSRIERQLDGCVVQENWDPPGGPSGKSFNIYNRITKQWEQYWVDATGRITHYVGEFKPDGKLYYEAEQFGSTQKLRMTFSHDGPDTVRQVGETSADGGKSWTVAYDLTYVRKK
jgi:tetratricopeptide (TPR) repeat protein